MRACCERNDGIGPRRSMMSSEVKRPMGPRSGKGVSMNDSKVFAGRVNTTRMKQIAAARARVREWAEWEDEIHLSWEIFGVGLTDMI